MVGRLLPLVSLACIFSESCCWIAILLVCLQVAVNDYGDADSDWLSVASDLADDLRELGSRTDNPRALVNSTGPWLTSSELWSVASVLRLCSETVGCVEGSVSGGGAGYGAGAGEDARRDTAQGDDA